MEDTDTILGLGSEWSNLLMDGLRGLQIRVIPVGNEMKDLLKEVFQNITSFDEGHRMYASLQMAIVLYKLIEYDRQWLERSVSNEISLAPDFIDQNKKEIFRWRRCPGTAICRCLISSCASSAKPAARQLFTFKTAHGRRQRDAQGWSFGYRYGA